MVSVSRKVAERLVKKITRYQKVLESARDGDINESDTIIIVTDPLADIFRPASICALLLIAKQRRITSSWSG